MRNKLIFLLFINILLSSQKIQFIGKIDFLWESNESLTLQETKSFCLTDDRLVIIPDCKAGNIKLYEINKNTLEIVNVIGRKGYGFGELSKPEYCYYDKEKSKLVLTNSGMKKIYIYDRLDRVNFKLINEISYKECTDIQIEKNKLFISGFIINWEKNYSFYSIDLTKKENNPDRINFLLPVYKKYGKTRFDIRENYAYFIWEDDLKIIKIDINTGENNIDKTLYTCPFEIKPPHYYKPENNNREDMTSFSYVRDIFVTCKYVIVIYEGPFNEDRRKGFWIQFYTLDGSFIRELTIPDNFDRRMWYDKDENILYSLVKQETYFLVKYKISE